MKGIAELKVSRERAVESYEEYKDALDTRFTDIRTGAEGVVHQAYLDLMSVYGHLRHGRSVIDFQQAIRDTGFDEQGWPRLAITRGDYRESFCGRNRNGRVFFSGAARNRGSWGSTNHWKEDISLPPDTQSENRPASYVVAKTPAPLIPPKFLPKDGPRNYYVLWEAEEWQRVRLPRRSRLPRDPMLLSRVNETIFVVLATWEMSELERTVLAGRIG